MMYNIIKNKHVFINILLLILAVSIVLMPQIKLVSVHYTYYDLGFISNQIYTYNSISDALVGHSYFYMPLMAALTKAISSKLFLHAVLLIQSILIVLCFITLRILFGFKASAIYLFSFPIWYLALFDFHFECFLLIPLVLYFFFIKQCKYLYAVISTLFIAAVKEPYILTAAFCVLYAAYNFYINKNRNIKLTFIPVVSLILLAALYVWFFLFDISKLIQSPFLSENIDIVMDNGFSWIKGSGFEKITFLISNLGLVMEKIFSGYRKMFFLFALLVAAGITEKKQLCPLFVVVPNLCILLLSTNTLHYKINSHYSAVFIIPLIVGAVSVTSSSLKSSAASFGRFLSLVVLSPTPFSLVFWVNLSWPYYHNAYIPSKTAKLFNSVEGQFDDTYKYVVQNNVITSNSVARQYLDVFPARISNQFSARHNVHNTWSPDIVIINPQYPIFYYDIYCGRINQSCSDQSIGIMYSDAVDMLHKNFALCIRTGGFEIYASHNVLKELQASEYCKTYQ